MKQSCLRLCGIRVLIRDVRPRRARPSPSTEGCRCVASSGSSGVTPWSSPPLLPHRRRPRPRPHRGHVAARPAYGLRQAVRVLRRLFRAPPLRQPDHSALCWKIWVPLLASSSTTTSPASPSRPRLLRLLQQQQALASSTSPSSAPATAMEAFSAGPPQRRRLVVHPPLHVRYWQHRCVPIVPDVFPSLASSGMCRLMA